MPTYQQVVAGLKLLQKAGIDYNVLCTVNRENVAYPEQVYQHFRELGIRFIQFIPIVELAMTVSLYLVQLMENSN